MASPRMSAPSYRCSDALPCGASHADRDGSRLPQQRTPIYPLTDHPARLLRRRATTVIERNHSLGASLVLFLFGFPVPLPLASVIAHRLRGRRCHVTIVGLR